MSAFNWGNPSILPGFRPYKVISFDEMQDTHIVRLIKDLHRKHNNVKDVDCYQVVPAQGATQLLWALFAMQKGSLTVPRPTFSFTNELSEIFKNGWTLDAQSLFTYPSNPSGMLGDVQGVKFVDACYHWEHYYNEDETLKVLDNDVIMFSMSKLSGDCQTRLGWALCKDETFARDLHDMIHVLNCGFYGEFMDNSIKALSLSLYMDMSTPRKELTSRNMQCKEILGNRMISQRGMFLYLKSNEKWRKLKIGMDGTNFGDIRENYRVNLACDSKDFQELLKALRKAYK